MRLLRSVSRPEQEDKSFPLERCEAHLSHVEINLGYLVSVVDSSLSMLSLVTCRVLRELQVPVEIGWEVFLLLLYFGLGSKWVVEWITMLFLEPVWHLGVLHVLDSV